MPQRHSQRRDVAAITDELNYKIKSFIKKVSVPERELVRCFRQLCAKRWIKSDTWLVDQVLLMSRERARDTPVILGA